MGYVPLPRDGLRAGCPAFVQRCSLGQYHWIVCIGARPQFKTREERNRHYQDYCCGAKARDCPYDCQNRKRTG